LPPLYDRWMQQCLPAAIPQEPKATCHDCAMCKAAAPESSREVVFFDSASKCCTYMPTLWNFLVGTILEDDTPEAAEGRRTVEARIDAGVAVTPLGLASPPVYQLLYSRIQDAFGQAQSMRCPHYIEEGGRCGVWRARESTCATWFCKYERGAVGREFWDRLHRLLVLAERGLSNWCVLQLDLGADALRSLIPERPPRPTDPMSAADFDHRADPKVYRQNWGRWVGKEREFYRRAAQLARDLSWSRVLGLGGAEAQVAEALVQEAFRRLTSTELPERLRAGSTRLTPEPDGGAFVISYSGYDPLRLSPAVLGILPFFDGRPTTAVVEAIQEKRGVQVTLPLVRRLVDFGVLEDAG
jgi:hypothetical protein